MASIRFDESCNLTGQFDVRSLPFAITKLLHPFSKLYATGQKIARVKFDVKRNKLLFFKFESHARHRFL